MAPLSWVQWVPDDIFQLIWLLVRNLGQNLVVEVRLRLIADPVIEAIARPEFEDGLRTGFPKEAAGAIGCSDHIKPRINSNPLLGYRLILGPVLLSYGPL